MILRFCGNSSAGRAHLQKLGTPRLKDEFRFSRQLAGNKECAGIAQLVEHNLAKVGVASSNLVSRSNIEANNTSAYAEVFCRI